MLSRGPGYLAPAADRNALLHTWSLAVEEQFYLVWPALLLFAGRRRGRFLRGRLVVVVAGVSLLSLVGSVWLTGVRQPWAFFGSPARAWEFGAGGLAALWPARARWLTRLAPAFGWVGLMAIGAAAAILGSDTPFPGTAALLPVGGAVLILLAGGAEPRGVAIWPLGAAPMQWIGSLSYSWYLWHWPVLVLARVAAGRLTGGETLVCDVGSLAIAAVAYHLVENPIRRSPALAVRPRAALTGAAMVTLSGICLAAGWRMLAARAEAEPGAARLRRGRPAASGHRSGRMQSRVHRHPVSALRVWRPNRERASRPIR